MASNLTPYRGQRPRSLSPYAAAWREYAWRERCGYLLLGLWLAALLFLAFRLRALFVFVIFPMPIRSLCLRSFRCPRCNELFGVSESAGFWGLARVSACVHCGLAKGAPADPDDYASSHSPTPPR
jgi:hypothetical protein